VSTTLHPCLNSGEIDYYKGLYWSGVGPHHERASFNLLYLLDAYSLQRSGVGPPYCASNGYGFRGSNRDIPKTEYATILEAKLAGREWFIGWLGTTGMPIEWRAHENGVHHVATADGLEIASYYHCKKKTETWHKGFRAHFGMTYYREHQITTPDQAMSVVTETWATWLRLARDRFLVNGAAELEAFLSVYRNLEQGEMLQIGDEGLIEGRWTRIADAFAGHCYIPQLMAPMRRLEKPSASAA
jgi:hypothetical protein